MVIEALMDWLQKRQYQQGCASESGDE
jgi:hypothetical protein